MVTRNIQHIGIIVEDAEVAAEWYIVNSGFKRIAQFETDGNYIVFIHSESANIIFELIQRPEGDPESVKAKNKGGWIDHIAFTVEDLEKEYKTAVQNNLEILYPITVIPEFWENGFEFFLVKTASGEKMEYCRLR